MVKYRCEGNTTSRCSPGPTRKHSCIHPNAELKYPPEGPARCVLGGTPAEAAALAGWGVAGWREGLCTFVLDDERGKSVLGVLELCCVDMLKHPKNNELKQDTAMAMKLHQRTKLQLLIYCSVITITTHLATEQPQGNPVRQEQQPSKHKYAISF